MNTKKREEAKKIQEMLDGWNQKRKGSETSMKYKKKQKLNEI